MGGTKGHYVISECPVGLKKRRKEGNKDNKEGKEGKFFTCRNPGRGGSTLYIATYCFVQLKLGVLIVIVK